jgi:hypothetical protein
MNTVEARKKLHDFIEYADEKEILELWLLIESNDDNVSHLYDKGTIEMLEQRSLAYLSGKSQIFTDEESMARIAAHRQKKGLAN